MKRLFELYTLVVIYQNLDEDTVITCIFSVLTLLLGHLTELIPTVPSQSFSSEAYWRTGFLTTTENDLFLRSK